MGRNRRDDKMMEKKVMDLSQYNLMVSYHVTDNLRRKHFACVSPLHGGGATQYYKNSKELKDGLLRIKRHRTFMDRCR